VAAASIVVGWAFLVLFLVGLKAVEDWKRDRVKRLTTQRDSARGTMLTPGRIGGSKTAPAVQSVNSGRGPDRISIEREDG
jgi:hypothetical protein